MRCLSRLLAFDHKRSRSNISWRYLELLNATQLGIYDVSLQWSLNGGSKPVENVPKKTKCHGLCVFWCLKASGKGQTFTEVYFPALLEQLKEVVKIERRYLAKKVLLFYHDNPPAHTPSVVYIKFHELPFELHQHIRQIYLQAIISCFRIWRNDLMVNDLI